MDSSSDASARLAHDTAQDPEPFLRLWPLGRADHLWLISGFEQLWAAQAIFKSPFWAKINNHSFLQLPALPTASNASR